MTSCVTCVDHIPIFETVVLTPSLAQPVKFPGLVMHGHICKQCFSVIYITSIFSAMRFDEDPFTCQPEKERKKG